MNDISKIKYKILKIRRIVLFLFLFLIISIIISYLFSFAFKIKPKLKKKIRLELMNKAQNIKDVTVISFLSNNIIQIKKGKMLNILSSKSISLKNGKMDGFDNLVTLPEFKSRVFKGKTELIDYDTISSDIKIPHRMKLNLKSNQKYYILTNNVFGNINYGNYISDKNFEINDYDFYISGDAFNTKSNLDYIKINGKACFKKREKDLPDKFTFEIYAKIFEIFNDKNYAEFFENVEMCHNPRKLKLDSNYSKAIFHFAKNKDLIVDEMLFLEDVIIKTENQIAKSNIGFYDLNKEKIVLLGEVKIKDIQNEAITKAEIYVYDTKTGTANSGIMSTLEEIFYPEIRQRIITLIPDAYSKYKSLISNLNTSSKRIKLIIKN